MTRSRFSGSFSGYQARNFDALTPTFKRPAAAKPVPVKSTQEKLELAEMRKMKEAAQAMVQANMRDLEGYDLLQLFIEDTKLVRAVQFNKYLLKVLEENPEIKPAYDAQFTKAQAAHRKERELASAYQ